MTPNIAQQWGADWPDRPICRQLVQADQRNPAEPTGPDKTGHTGKTTGKNPQREDQRTTQDRTQRGHTERTRERTHRD